MNFLKKIILLNYHISQIFFWKEFKYIVNEFFSNIEKTSNLRKFLKKNIKFEKKKNNVSFSFKNTFLFSSNLGLFIINESQIQKIFAGDVHGVSICKDVVFFSVFTGIHSSIIKAKLIRNKLSFELREKERILSFETLYGNERIHGLSFDKETGNLCFANTQRNSICYVDINKKKIVNEIFIMKDKTGLSISSDHNHVNSVNCINNFVLFTCHSGSVGIKKRGGSLVGFTDKKKIFFFKITNRGVHDINLISNDLYICDSFGNYKTYTGRLLRNGKPFMENLLRRFSSNYMLRGLGISGNEFLIGCSNINPDRSLRKKNSGGLIFMCEKNIFFKKLQSSQINEIKCVNDKDVRVGKANLLKIFEKSFGKCIYQQEIEKNFISKKINLI